MSWFRWVPLSLIVVCSCSSPEQSDEEAVDPNVIPQVPTPPADGPQLVATGHRVVIRDRPHSAGQVLGTLAKGARVARGAEAHSTHGCSGGWYNIRPSGWVCNGDGVSLSLDVPAAHLPQARLDRPLPYRYARVVSSAAVAYGSVPSVAEQQEAEPKPPKAREPAPLGLSANDVPLDDSYLPAGIAVLMPEAEGVTDDGTRSSHSWWVFPTNDPAFAEGATLGDATEAGQTRVLKGKSGIALAHSFTVGGDDARRFGVTPDGQFVPTARLTPSLGTTWHGLALSDSEGLPVAFALRRGIHAYKLGDNASVERLDDEFEPKEVIPLTGRFRTVNGLRYFYTSDDQWIRHKDLILIPKRNKFPDWATPEQKWLDISLANQTLVAWQGHKPVYATLISSGSDRLGDPQTGPSTVQGVFRLRHKHVTRSVDDREVGQAYSITDAPWVMEFQEGFSITGCYWHSRFGEARSYHDIALAPVDAHFLWHWAGPQVPEGWHSLAVAEDAADNTIIYVHK